MSKDLTEDIRRASKKNSHMKENKSLRDSNAKLKKREKELKSQITRLSLKTESLESELAEVRKELSKYKKIVAMIKEVESRSDKYRNSCPMSLIQHLSEDDKRNIEVYRLALLIEVDRMLDFARKEKII